MHETDEPDFIADFLEAHLLAGEDGAEIDFASTEADATTVGDGDGSVVERIGQAECHAIEGGEIWSAMAGAITDQQRRLHQQRFRSHGTNATRPEEFHKREQQGRWRE